MKIRQASLADVSALLPLYEDLGYPTTQKLLSQRLENILSNSTYGCLVAEEKEEILGFLGYVQLCFFEDEGSYFRILALSVRQESRRKGIGTALLNELKKIAEQNRVKALTLNSGLGVDRQVAYRFYEKFGFEKVTTGFGLYLEE
ncbi:GNAT family N-acetyltransferase [Streptococcus oricebi]|uniref:GNAT family N-acetyltransferase n=1 Tax=Streptococcus oricebi TaxID=1547447 RepID=A0ABS5B342_9STRE|nr:GNAT family N-acetyltransferase [Streptococcus oricebi]MBP2623091.1 GNAT family N-acetyltransferase [Streptococcus oricebi]